MVILSESKHRKQFGAGKTKAQWAGKYQAYVDMKKGVQKTPTVQVVDEEEMEQLIDRFDDEFVAEHFTTIHNQTVKEVHVPDPDRGLDRDSPKSIRQIGSDGHAVRIKPIYISNSGRGLVGTSGSTITQKLIKE